MAQGPKPTEPEEVKEVNHVDLKNNTQLWLGKDYSNFIKRDWVQLDRPFEGTVYTHYTPIHNTHYHSLCHLLTHTHTHTPEG